MKAANWQKFDKINLYNLFAINNRNTKIVILMENADMNETLKDLLEMEGFDVKTLDNFKDTKELLTKEKQDLIIIDGDMEGFNYELVSELKELQSQIKVILLFSKPTLEDAINGIRFSISDLLIKPIDFYRLRKSLLKISDKSKS